MLERDTVKRRVLDALEKTHIPFRILEHEPVMTIEDCRVIDEAFHSPVAKNLFLQNRTGTEFYLLTMRGEKSFHTAAVSRQIGSSRLSFAGPEKLLEYLETLPGALSPMGLLFDTQKKVRYLMDEDLRRDPKIVVHPAVNTASVELCTSDLTEKFLPYCEHTITWIKME